MVVGVGGNARKKDSRRKPDGRSRKLAACAGLYTSPKLK
jgi:hypothetical protein